MQKRIVKCPTCGKDADFSASNLFRPFCQERCQLIDLGQWADGKYAIPTNEKVNPDMQSNKQNDDDGADDGADGEK